MIELKIIILYQQCALFRNYKSGCSDYSYIIRRTKNQLFTWIIDRKRQPVKFKMVKALIGQR